MKQRTSYQSLFELEETVGKWNVGRNYMTGLSKASSHPQLPTLQSNRIFFFFLVSRAIIYCIPWVWRLRPLGHPDTQASYTAKAKNVSCVPKFPNYIRDCQRCLSGNETKAGLFLAREKGVGAPVSSLIKRDMRKEPQESLWKKDLGSRANIQRIEEHRHRVIGSWMW